MNFRNSLVNSLNKKAKIEHLHFVSKILLNDIFNDSRHVKQLRISLEWRNVLIRILRPKSTPKLYEFSVLNTYYYQIFPYARKWAVYKKERDRKKL